MTLKTSIVVVFVIAITCCYRYRCCYSAITIAIVIVIVIAVVLLLLLSLSSLLLLFSYNYYLLLLLLLSLLPLQWLWFCFFMAQNSSLIVCLNNLSLPFRSVVSIHPSILPFIHLFIHLFIFAVNIGCLEFKEGFCGWVNSNLEATPWRLLMRAQMGSLTSQVKSYLQKTGWNEMKG